MLLLDLVSRFDLGLFHMVNGWSGNWTLDRIAGFEERNFLFKGGVLITAYWWFWFATGTARRAGNRRLIVAALVGTVLALVVNRAMASGLPFRLRPMYDAASGFRHPSLDIDYNMESWSSFPSDSATFWFALSFGLFRLSRPVGTVAMLYSAAWMCLARLYLGIHWPSDLLVGAALGVAGVWAAERLLALRGGAVGRWVGGWLDAAEQRAPQLFYAAAFLLSFELTMIFDDVRTMARGAVHALKAGGYIAAGEGKALFAIGGGLLLLAAIAIGMAVLLRRRQAQPRRNRRSAGLDAGATMPAPRNPI